MNSKTLVTVLVWVSVGACLCLMAAYLPARFGFVEGRAWRKMFGNFVVPTLAAFAAAGGFVAHGKRLPAAGILGFVGLFYTALFVYAVAIEPEW